MGFGQGGLRVLSPMRRWKFWFTAFHATIRAYSLCETRLFAELGHLDGCLRGMVRFDQQQRRFS
ncbi:hypothetical protein CSC82_03855 [Rhodobacteraceae bacterium 4F10]|nr:hypothetical protein CSC82_03855 [Rhodobacteraceae bacterium 4F10]